MSETEMASATPVWRTLPEVTEDTRFFWTSGRDGVLRFQRCSACRRYVHPPGPVCVWCGTPDPQPEAVSGRGTLYSHSTNYQQWVPADEPYTYIVGLVELIEQEALRLTTNIVNCAEEDLWIGMPVQVTFEQHGEVWLPLFEPAAEER